MGGSAEIHIPINNCGLVHRIGRTGRGGKSGISPRFFQRGDKSHAGELQQVMRQAGQAVPDSLIAQ